MLSDDPAEAMLAGLSEKIGDLERLLANIQTVAAGNVARLVVSALPRSIDRAVAAGVGAALVVSLASGIGIGWWLWHGDAPTVYGIKAGTEQCTATTQGRLCWQPYLVPNPPKPNPALFRS